jgi:hypothetical protein
MNKEKENITWPTDGLGGRKYKLANIWTRRPFLVPIGSLSMLRGRFPIS